MVGNISTASLCNCFHVGLISISEVNMTLQTTDYRHCRGQQLLKGSKDFFVIVFCCISVSNTDLERVIGTGRKEEGSQEAHDMSLR